MQLDKEQEQAVQTLTGPLMVIACAGSGKTTVILNRIRALLDHGADPGRILAVTFSRAGAGELGQRFSSEGDTTGIQFRTIHSLCYQVLSQRYGRDKMKFLGAAELYAFLEEVRIKYREEYDDLLGNGDTQAVSDLQNDLSHCMITEYLAEAGLGNKEPVPDTIRQICQDYRKFKRDRKEIDFDDLVIMTHRVFTREPATLALWQSRFDYCMIDEYQDTSRIQAELFFMLMERTGNICVVGDDDQSIYGFRDADPRIFFLFESRYPHAVRVTLSTNYRSLPGIVDRSSNLVRHNRQRYPKKFQAARQGEAGIRTLVQKDHIHQAIELTKQVKNDLDFDCLPGEIAVLYRERRQAMMACYELMWADVPFTLNEPMPDLARGNVWKDLMCYYRLSQDMGTARDLRRIINRPVRYISPRAIEDGMSIPEIYRSCVSFAQKAFQKQSVQEKLDDLFGDLKEIRGMTPTQFVNYFAYGVEYYAFLEERAKYLGLQPAYFQQEFDLLRKIALRFKTMDEYIDYISHYNENLTEYSKMHEEDGISLTTFHGSKGREWRKVYIISAEEGDLSRVSPAEREEERRLFYVAMTRARDELTIMHTEHPCQFLAESKKKN